MKCFWLWYSMLVWSWILFPQPCNWFTAQTVLNVQQTHAHLFIYSCCHRDPCKPFFFQRKILTVTNLYVLSVLLYINNNILKYVFFNRESWQHIWLHFKTEQTLDKTQHRLANIGKCFLNCLRLLLQTIL